MFTSLFQLEQKPVTLFSSLDNQAPILTGEAGSLKTLLKACLVTGYGDKQGLGWQMLHETEDKNSACFMSNDPTSSKYLLKIDNSNANVKLSAYQTMSDFNSGQKPLVENQIYQLKACEWRLIGHSKAFILLLDYIFGSSNNQIKVAYPLLFADLPRQTKRLAPVCVFWCARKAASYDNSGGVQSVLFHHVNGSNSNSTGRNHASAYPFVVNNGQAGANLTKNYCRFSYDSHAGASVLYEPILVNLPDSTWSFLPMLQPLSARLADVANLGLITETTIKANTGYYGGNEVNDNLDCAVPINWWYA